MSTVASLKITDEVNHNENGSFVNFTVIYSEDFTRSAVKLITIEVDRDGSDDDTSESIGFTESEFDKLYSIMTRIKALKDNT